MSRELPVSIPEKLPTTEPTTTPKPPSPKVSNFSRV